LTSGAGEDGEEGRYAVARVIFHGQRGELRQRYPLFSETDAELPDPRPLQQITISTLLIMGERDIDKFQAIAHHIACAIPHLTKLVLPGVGHMANMEASQTLNEAVLRFLGNLKHHYPEPDTPVSLHNVC
jgi:pimeloyl-ACP methyl ester carboxylesterase